ncbi:MAG: hypothetical protein LLF97_10605 [Planctomycetaceae bacterium]|nr:hypothetical protein [Planctomycetaceae bacterium]
MFKRIALLWVVVYGFALSSAVAQAADSSYEPQPFGGSGLYTAAAMDHMWRDVQRNRDVPARIYYPTGGDRSQKFPVILLSTGLGQSRSDCDYLGRHWARCGYVSVHVQHLGSDSAVRQKTLRPRKELREAFYSPQNIQDRPVDVLFVLAELDAMQREGVVPIDRCDLSRIGLSGHDFGAQTVLGVAGQVLPGYVSYAEPRVKAVVAMGAPVPLGQVPLDIAFADMASPCLYITGTADNSIVATTQANQRRLPFDHAAGPDQFLITFFGSDHLVYSGNRRGPAAANDVAYQRLIAECSTAFWDAYLKGNAGARAWVTGHALTDHVGHVGRVEKKVESSPKRSSKA